MIRVPSPDRLRAPTPRYTSYPTAVHFSSAVGPDESGAWIAALPETAALSLYVHIPFCGALCWYCGCATTVVNTPGPIAGYLEALEAEIGAVADRLGPRRRVTHLHWGGGSPNSLQPDQILGLAGGLRDRFTLDPEAEFAVEIDPRFMDAARAEALARAGVNRVSIGVQDFSPEVQAAINRRQSFETTRAVVEDLRRAGIGALNIDLVYGLPHQTEARLADTLDQALALRPDRLAVFGYAHLPQRIRHQRLIPEAALPGFEARLRLAELATRRLVDAGYVRIGLDHFAQPDDPLAQAPAQRNFQGYTTDRADALIGLGASAISRFPQGYAQNATGVADYRARIAAGGRATARGVALSDDDRLRAHVIERLMCDLTYSDAGLRRRFGDRARSLAGIVADMDDLEAEGLIERTDDGFRIPEAAAPFVRTVCTRFDAWLARADAIHAPAV
ncbi:oxygen-independent coproporphyrinogen III oxidase [Brevundimonas sp.]|uniref:oxygen-independent coproporphyrinogen III oxidase n=1 Tax=Brevundimonas sp. TaxID=1871086 RepID=UPI001DCE92EC|nr:oxygen-independent coproporphyrinogen III oxidase [Brevundimonas sp.]MBL0948773.1 oxygen-independent coproporphyrinogen III oxidase [Brevundimonas sp.]